MQGVTVNHRTQARDGTAADATCRSEPEDLRSVVDQLEAVARALPAYLPDPGHGAEWVQFDSAVVDLHRALVSLRAIERGRG
jgi:hypothetical protein